MNLFQDRLISIGKWSGGKDSTVMLHELCRGGYPLDYIVFCNTMYEFPVMYEYIERLKIYFEDRYSKEVVILTPKSTFEEWCFGVLKRGDHIGQIRGIPLLKHKDSNCYWRRESKVKPFEEWVKNTLEGQENQLYIGYTKDENRSINEPNIIYPLKDEDYFPMTEDECKEYLRDMEMENPLYRYFDRTGCMMCPAQSEYAWLMVFTHFKDTWEWMRDIETRLFDLEKRGYQIVNKYWFDKHRTMDNMEELFKTKKADELDTSPLKDCLCKI